MTAKIVYAQSGGIKSRTHLERRREHLSAAEAAARENDPKMPQIAFADESAAAVSPKPPLGGIAAVAAH